MFIYQTRPASSDIPAWSRARPWLCRCSTRWCRAHGHGTDGGATRRRRLGFVYVPHGVILNQWTPTSASPGFELPPILQAARAVSRVVTVVSNLARPEELLQDHACTGSWLTGVPPKRPRAAIFWPPGASIRSSPPRSDATRSSRRSKLATEDFGSLIGACMAGYSCAYMNTLSWQTPTKPLPMEINPRSVFERMFGWESTSDQRLARMRADRSVLDVVTAGSVRADACGRAGAIATAG